MPPRPRPRTPSPGEPFGRRPSPRRPRIPSKTDRTMFLRRLFLVAALVTFLGGTAFLAREAETPGQKMTGAASKFVSALDAGQARKAKFNFDDKERYRWFFPPQQNAGKSTRKGLPLGEMTDDQRKLALTLLRS